VVVLKICAESPVAQKARTAARTWGVFLNI
jgi:hypothetical protein